MRSLCVQVASGGLRYDHVLIALMDDNPYLSDGSKQVQEVRLDLHVSRLSQPLMAFLRWKSCGPVFVLHCRPALNLQVLATTASLASMNKSKVTVLLVDGKSSTGEGSSWIEAASWYVPTPALPNEAVLCPPGIKY